MKNRTVAALSLISGTIVGAFAVGAFVRYQQAGAKEAGEEAASTFELLPWLGLLFELLGKMDWLNFLLVLGGFFILGMLVVWQLTPGDGFDLRELVCDQVVRPADGKEVWKVRGGKMFQTGAFVITTWIMIKLTTSDKMTPEYLILYAALWAASPVMNRWAQSKYPVAADSPPIEPLSPAPPAATITTETKVTTT